MANDGSASTMERNESLEERSLAARVMVVEVVVGGRIVYCMSIIRPVHLHRRRSRDWTSTIMLTMTGTEVGQGEEGV